MYSLLKKILFLFDPEKIHHFTFKLVKFVHKLPFTKNLWKKWYCIKSEKLEKEVFGLRFKNPVGLAAGFDKDAKLFNELSYCGFGFIEIGTLTPKPQKGNPKKRLFRLVQDEGIINRMGFNNEGVEKAAKRLKKRNTSVIIGGNIGKNKTTPNQEAQKDYIICFNQLFDYVDYFVVNVSSPNTPNLRDLQEKEPLTNLLNTLVEENKKRSKTKPILLKIAPDLSNSQLDDIIDIVKTTRIDGVIATNTTISRDHLKEKNIDKIGPGGLSGKPLKSKSTSVIKYLSEKSQKSFPIIGVGGIHSAKDALEKIEAGADLVQIYTGFIYEGPKLIKEINKELLKRG